ncbi:MAG TPA: cation:proton antiporter, partial [Spirochaetales bacterium]|nr:cation:proton antiporter [Spirochaetales bacterium]
MNSINEPAGIFALLTGIAVLAPYISDKFGIPIVATMTLAGIVLGPQVLGILEPNILLQFMGSIGLIFAFFTAGLEVNARIMQRHRQKVWLFGTVTFLLPFVIGFAFGYLVLHQGAKSAILLGAFLASSGALASHPFQRIDLAGRDSVEVSKGGAAIASFLVVVILFVLSAFLPNGDSFLMGREILIYSVFIVVASLVLPRIASLIARKTRIQGTVDAISYLFLLFSCSYIGFLLGIPGYISAFLVGVLISPYLSASRITAGRIDFLGNAIFVPFLLVFIGISADFSLISSVYGLILLVVGSTVLGIGSKYFAAWFAAKSFGYSKADQGILFGYSSNYSVFSISIISVAGSLGLLNQPLVTGAILLVILSSILASVAARNSESAILPSSPSVAIPPQGSSHGNRVLVALSKPTTAQALMDLGITLRGADATTPIFPLAVVSNDPASESESRQYAENMLAGAVMQGAASQVPVIPISQSSVNVAKGILDAAAEQDANVIIIGWNKSPRLSNAFFGSVIDQVISSGNQMVVVARTVERLTASHIVMVVPPLCEQHPGFGVTVKSLSALVRKNQAKAALLTLQGYGSILTKSLKENGFLEPVQVLEIASWKDINQGIKQLPSGKKSFVLLSARPSEPSWHPAIERLPHRIGEEFPDSNLLMVYFPSTSNREQSSEEAGASPREEAGASPLSGSKDYRETEQARPVAQEDTLGPGAPAQDALKILKRAIANGTVRVNMGHSAIADAILELVSAAFPFDRKLANRYGTRLAELVQRQPIEIEPGVILLHDRVPGIEEPIVCLGAHRQGFRIALLDRPVEVIIVLFVPEDQPHEKHLAFLGQIAHLFKDQGLAQRLLHADKPEDIL